MARRLRIPFPGARYHVINRGNLRHDIFATAGARRSFAGVTGEACEKFGWRMHAYIVMRNHFHLALETPEPNVVAGMHWLQSTFAVRLLRFHGQHGHVFQESGRFRAELTSAPKSAPWKRALARTLCDVVAPPYRCLAEKKLGMGKPGSVRAYVHAAAKAAGVVTQMGNQGRAAEGIRLAREWVQAGLLGDVHTVHTWTDRPRAPWFLPAEFDPDANAVDATPPPTLDWDLWLGASPTRPYRREFVPLKWRGFSAFGTGSLGDMGCHQLDAPFFALDLGAPESVEAATTQRFPKTFPASSAVTWRFPARSGRGPVELRWFDGTLRPPLPVPGFRLAEGGGSLFYGTKGAMWVASHSASARLLPESRMRELSGSLPAKSIPRIAGGHYQEWCRAIRGGPACGSNFDYAAPLTEAVLLGVVAQRTQARLTWDAAAMRFPNFPDADALLGPGYAYRPGWGVT